MAKRQKQIPAWMADYYRNSISGSVVDHYATGRVVTVNADRNRADAIAKAKADLQAADAEIDRRYWLFSRSTSASLHGIADDELYARRNEARARLRALRA